MTRKSRPNVSPVLTVMRDEMTLRRREVRRQKYGKAA